MKKIGIIGGGPAGLYAAIILAEKGFDVSVYDHRIPHEKPCGGGITSKAFRVFPILKDIQTEMYVTDCFEIIDGNDQKVIIDKATELHIVSRKKLSEYMLNKALKAGVKHIPEKVITCYKKANSIVVKSENTEQEFEYLIGADGAHGMSRKLMGAESFAKNRYGAMGYYIEGLTDYKIKIKFYKGRSGYLWTFPRPGHASVGIGFPAGEMGKTEVHKAVEDFLKEHYPGFELKEDHYYSATIPYVQEWKRENIQGQNWALIGDAGGFTDAITGEGIYYAFKSAEILAEALINGKEDSYFDGCNEIMAELAKSYSIMPRFYRDRNIGLLVKMCKRSPFIRALTGRLITGEQSYLTLKKFLIKNSPRIGAELMMGIFRKT